MGDSRWPQICMREDVREILNNNKSKWGEELEKLAFKELGKSELIQGIWDYKVDNCTGGKIDRGLNAKMEQEIQNY